MIYFIRLPSGAIKIGQTGEIGPRMTDHRRRYGGLEILHTMEGGKQVEAGLHERFAHLRFHRSEQFKPGHDLLAFIGRLDLLPRDPDGVEKSGAKKESCPARQFRLEDDTLRKIDELAIIFGGALSPMSRAAVIRHAIEAAHDAEIRAKKNP